MLIKIFKAEETEDLGYKKAKAGEIVAINKKELIVKTGDESLGESFLAIHEIQLPGKKRLSIKKVLQGYNFKIGEKFT